MRRPGSSLARVVVGVFVAGAMTTACGVPADRSASVAADEDVPYELLSPTTTAPTAVAPVRAETTICLEIDGLLLSLGRDRRGASSLENDLDLLIAGPTEGESTLGVRSALEGGEAVLGVERAGSLAAVELSEEFVELPADQQLLAVAQMTCTLTSQPGVSEVTFLLDGRRLEVPVQGGELVARPVVRADYRDLLAN